MTHDLTRAVIKLPVNTPTTAVDDFLFVPQDDPNRPGYYVAGDLYTALTTTRESNFVFNAFDFFFPVNGGPPPHVHFYEQETFYVTAGEVRFRFGNKGNYSLVLPENSYFFGPEDRIHSPGNIGSTASISGITPGARVFAITTPGSLDLFFDAVGTQVADRSRPIPVFSESTSTGFLNREAQARFTLRLPGAPSVIGEAVDPNYQPPEDALDYIIVLPKDADGELVKAAKALDAELDELTVWTTDDLAEVPKRPTFSGAFDIEYTSLTNLEESGGEFSLNQFSLEPTDGGNFFDPVKSEDYQLFYVNQGQLSIKVGNQVRLVGKDTYFYIAPGNEYSIANFGDETVEALATTVINQKSELLQQDELSSPLNSQGGVSPKNLIFLSDKADFLDARLVQKSNGHLRIYGAAGNDEILVKVENRAFGENGDDLLDASLGCGRNLLDGGNGNDILIAGSNDQLVGGDGDDILIIRQGGNNLLYGGFGADEFRIVNSKLPDAVEVTYPEDIRLPAGVSLPELVDTRNTIVDFKLGIDKIHILGLEDFVSSFEDLQLLPAFGNIGSTSIIATITEDGIKKEISLANVQGVIFNELSSNDFVFA